VPAEPALGLFAELHRGAHLRRARRELLGEELFESGLLALVGSGTEPIGALELPEGSRELTRAEPSCDGAMCEGGERPIERATPERLAIEQGNPARRTLRTDRSVESPERVDLRRDPIALLLANRRDREPLGALG